MLVEEPGVKRACEERDHGYNQLRGMDKSQGAGSEQGKGESRKPETHPPDPDPKRCDQLKFHFGARPSVSPSARF